MKTISLLLLILVLVTGNAFAEYEIPFDRMDIDVATKEGCVLKNDDGDLYWSCPENGCIRRNGETGFIWICEN